MILSDFVEYVESYLYSFGGFRPKVGSLAEPIAAGGGCVVSLDDPSLMERGVVQVSGGGVAEAMQVVSRDVAGGGVVPSWGRTFGGLGDPPPAHAAGAKVTVNPLITITEIERTAKAVLDSLYPRLFAVRSTFVTFEAGDQVYGVPSDCESVLSVDYEADAVYPNVRWVPVTRMRLDSSPDLAVFPSGRALSIWPDAAPVSGSRIRVVYRAPFGDIGAMSLSDAGVLDRWVDLLRLGVLARLVQGLELQRAQAASVAASGRGDAATPFYSTNISKQLFGEFERRIQEERRRLLSEFPGRVVRSL